MPRLALFLTLSVLCAGEEQAAPKIQVDRVLTTPRCVDRGRLPTRIYATSVGWR